MGVFRPWIMNQIALREQTEDLEIPKRILGKTGYEVCIFSLGGQGALETQRDESEMVKIIQRAYELGVNYFDTSPVYGPSEDYYGEAIGDFRDDIFLATKTDDRTRDGSLKFLEKSLERLKTDYLDLWQIHHLENIEEVDQVSEKGGALEALIEMQEQGVVRHLGFTGHEDPDILVEMSRRHDFDTVLLPTNPADIHFTPSFEETMMAEAEEQNLGVIGMKVFAQGFIFHPDGINTVWEGLSYALSMPVSTVIVGCDSVEQLEENVAIAKVFQPLTEEQMTDAEERVKKFKKRAQFFRKEYGGYDAQKELEPLPRVKSD